MKAAHSTIPGEIVGAGFRNIEDVVLMGSGVLELAGIRVARDIDIVTTRGNRDGLQADRPDYWRRLTHRRNRVRDGSEFQITSLESIDGRFDVWRHWYDPRREQGDRQVYTDELKECSVRHKLGFYVLRLEEMINLKWASGGEKNFRDVELYDRWLRDL